MPTAIRLPRSPVEKERAMQHAQLSVRRAFAGGFDEMKDMARAEFDPDPLVIHDLNGEPLFYEFSAMRGKRQAGLVKAGASKLIGSPVTSVQMGPRKWSPKKAVKVAERKAQKAVSGGRLIGSSFVCYSYPKIGVKVDVRGARGETRSLIYDVADGTRIKRFGYDELEGQVAWSYLEEMVGENADRRQKLWEMRDEELDAAIQETPKAFAKSYTAREAVKVLPSLAVVSRYPIPFYSSRVLKFSPRCNAHDCFELYAQQTNVYCAVATGQMILDFYRYHYDQDDIAAAMGTGAGGTSNTGQVNGYESLSNNCLDATYDTSANWSEAKAEIDENRPVKSGIPGHARACAGWKRQNLWLIGQPRKYWLRIYDPWPWNSDICNGGALYWEDWDSITHTNFIYVRHRSTSCT